MKNIISLDMVALNEEIMELIKRSMPQLTQEQCIKMIADISEIAGKSIALGIQGGIADIASRLLDERAKVTPLERYVDTMLIYSVLGLEDRNKKKPSQCFSDIFNKFLADYQKKGKFAYLSMNNERRAGIAIRFENEPIKERDASSIIGTEVLWFMHNNRRLLVYDGNFCFSDAVIKRFKGPGNNYRVFTSSCMVMTNLTRNIEGWNIGTESWSHSPFQENSKDLELDYIPLG
jgi:hypothetical protein